MKKYKLYNMKIIKTFCLFLFFYVTIFSFASFGFELISLYNMKKSFEQTFESLSQSWDNCLYDLPTPDISVGSPFTVRAEASNFLPDNKLNLTAVYNPNKEIISANLFLTDTSGKKHEMYAFSDLYNAGVCFDGADGVYYTVPASKFKNLMSVPAIVSLVGIPSYIPKDISFDTLSKYVNLFAIDSSCGEIDKNKLLRSGISLVTSLKLESVRNITFTSDGNEQQGKMYNYKISSAKVKQFVDTVCTGSDGENVIRNQSIKKMYNKVFCDDSDGFFEISILVNKQNVHMIKLKTPEVDSLSYLIDLYIDSLNGKIDLEITGENSHSDVISASFLPEHTGFYSSIYYHPTQTGIVASSDIKERNINVIIKDRYLPVYRLYGQKNEDMYKIEVFDSQNKSSVKLLLTPEDKNVCESLKGKNIFNLSIDELFVLNREFLGFRRAIEG